MLQDDLHTHHIHFPLVDLVESHGQSIHALEVDGNDAVETWRLLRELSAELKHWPVIIGGPDDVRALLEGMEANPDAPVADVVRSAVETNLEGWFIEREQETGEVSRTTWPDNVRCQGSFSIHTDVLTGDPLPQVTIGLIPTLSPWEVPAWLQFGGWNDCPEPILQVAVMKRWYERYGAVLAGMSGDTVEFAVTRGPQGKDEALRLAREQYLYCTDVVDQGYDTLDDLAASLVGATVWFCWWD